MKKGYGGFITLYTFSYMAIGVMMPLIGQYLKHAGFSGTQIGIITASGTFAAILGSTFWGKVYANAVSKKILLVFLCFFAAVTSVALSGIYIYVVFILGYAVMYFFQAPVMALSDALTIDEKKPFGYVRMWGAVGFALGIFVSANIAEALGLGSIFFIYAGCFIICAWAVIMICRREKSGRECSAPVGKTKKVQRCRYRDLRNNKKLLMLLLSAFFLCGTNVANNTYFSFLYIKEGGTLAGVGLAFLLMAGSEAPFMAWTVKLSKRLGTEKLILLAMILSVIRFAWYGTSPVYWLLLVFFFLQGAVNGIILVEFVKYVSSLVLPAYNGVAISAYYAFSSSFSAIVCQFVGGVMLDNFGAAGVYVFFAIYNLIGLMLYIIFGMYKKREKKGK